MQILFLGTGSGRASLNRDHTSLLLRNENYSALIDCGDGISKSLLQNNISFNEIDSAIISHLHADHAAGLPSLLTQMKLKKRTKPINIYIHKELVEILKNILNSFFLFAEGLPFEVIITGYDFGSAININSKLAFKGVKNSHIYNKYNISYMAGEKFVSSSFLFSTPERNVYYSADAGGGEDLFLFDEKIDFIISETTHIQPEKFLQALVKYEPEKILLTHIDDEAKLTNWLNSIDKKIKKYFIVTCDGMSFNIN